MEISLVFDTLLELYAKYSNVHRRTISLGRFKDLQAQGQHGVAEVLPDSNLLRETLVEHVGTLPIIASYLHPHIEHFKQVDLGKVLIMLAIHDIGETIVGDAHPHQRSTDFVDLEHQAALRLLPPYLHSIFEELEARETFEARYANSVDVFSRFLSECLLPPDLVRQSLTIHGFSWQGIEKNGYEIFEWDAILKGLFAEVVQRYRTIEKVSI